MFVQLVGGAAVFALAWTLFVMWDFWPRAYGWTEVLIGMASVSLSLSDQPASNFERVIKLGTGVYLMVRGHDNRINGYARLQQRQLRLIEIRLRREAKG